MGSLLQRLYNSLIRDRLPRKIGVLNGIPVRQPRLFDKTDKMPGYENALISAINESVSEGDSVVVVGGGWGVGTVVAAQNAGESGGVITFEGSEEQVEHVRETVELNQIGSRTDIEHAIVGTDVNVYGESSGATEIPPEDLPECDILVLDCEGAETEILQHAGKVGKSIVVETHPMYDAPSDEVKSLLEDEGFVVETTRYEPSSYGELPVLTASRDDHSNRK